MVEYVCLDLKNQTTERSAQQVLRLDLKFVFFLKCNITLAKFYQLVEEYVKHIKK
jgi:hypothetical protein